VTRIALVAPPFDGPPTGGTLYGARLAAALCRRGVLCERLGVDEARSRLASGDDGAFFVDSLHLDDMPALARAANGSRKPTLLVHYLPSLVEKGDMFEPSCLSAIERAALDAADRLIAPSQWMASLLLSTGVSDDRVAVVEPGVEVARSSQRLASRERSPLAVVLVGNLVSGKGILPFLRALGELLSADVPPIRLTIAGDPSRDAPYASECRGVVQQSAALREIVRFTTPSHAEALAAIAASDVFVSASRMESYGMALAEARAAGVPIVARAGGNVAAHVDPASGGELVPDVPSLGSALVRLAQHPAELARRRSRAERAVHRRSWDEAAGEFLLAGALSR